MTAIFQSAGGALANNPFVDQSVAMPAQGKAFVLPGRNTNISSGRLDFTSTADIAPAQQVRQDGWAHGFDDASPSSIRN
ncbi:hypothetical protein [Ochrobactrum sp. EDr1-4]|uniref:hypothetical protein n=1 Tax=Ochrobactrum sp. EDr1-4 TaxID=3368622 RepID=UPI003B9EA036